MSFVSVLVRGSRLRSGAFWPARVVSVVQSTTEQPSARSADPSDRDANNTGERTFRVKRGIGYHSVFQLGAVPGNIRLLLH